ncbi:glutamate receptor 2.7 [Citrus sinensis]|uniref:Glutamate receptor 2.7 n=1 Tax=Citrus sinensis TaxID=2711 RepID=A0ACB8NKI1_CITSI|nr:glutamate receptor 2.7 [Citrus sinensis]
MLGPEDSMPTNFIIQPGNKSQVPILSFSATSPSLTSIRSPYFFRGALNDSSQVGAITAIIKAFGWREAVPIYVDNQYGEAMIPSLTDALHAIDTRVPYRSVISPLATDDQIEKELYKLFTMQTRVFIVHKLPSLGSRIFEKANEIGTRKFWSSMEKEFLKENPSLFDAELNIIGLLAYDATRALAEAVEKAGITSFGFDKINVSSNATDLEAFGISQNGPKLLQALSSTRFKGLTGDYIFVDGQLQSSAFEIINVNNGARGVGFWTPEKGLTQKLSSNSTTKSKFKPIIWSGDSTSDPKGWEPDGSSSGSYNDLIYQVFLGEFDAVVGDITIVFNRSNYVGFTLPYTESGVINDDFRGPAKHQVGTSFWFSFSTMVFSQSFDERKLVVYNSPEDCHELFQKGSANGGIAAALDEIPYMKLLIGQHCSKYTMIEPKFKTAGFGFVFPLHSPLVHDVSKAILNVTEGDKMKEIEDAWFKKHSSCPDASTVVSSRSLGLNSFWDKCGIQVHGMGATEASPDSRYPASPSSYSQHADSHFLFYEEQGTPRTEYGNSNHNPKSQAQAPRGIVSAVELTSAGQEMARSPHVIILAYKLTGTCMSSRVTVLCQLALHVINSHLLTAAARILRSAVHVAEDFDAD